MRRIELQIDENLEQHQRRIARRHFRKCKTCPKYYVSEDEMVEESVRMMNELLHYTKKEQIDQVHEWIVYLH